MNLLASNTQSLPQTPGAQATAANSLVVAVVDEVTDQILARAAHSAGLDYLLCSTMSDARSLIEARQDPTILVADQNRMRARWELPTNVRAFSILGPGHDEAVPSSGAEVITRPMSIHSVASRLRAADIALGSAPDGFEDVLDAAVEAGSSGEVCVTDQNDFARVYLDAGEIAWVHRAGNRVSMRSLLARIGVEVDADTVADVRNESRQRQRYFGDVLIEWGLVKRDDLERALRDHFASELEVIAGWRNAQTTYFPVERPRSSTLKFCLDDLRSTDGRVSKARPIAAMAAVEPEPAAPPMSEIEPWLAVLQSEGCESCALLDIKAGSVLGNRGLSALDVQTAWGLAAAYVGLGDGDAEVIGRARGHAFLLRSASPRFEAIAVARFDESVTCVAMARLTLARHLQ